MTALPTSDHQTDGGLPVSGRAPRRARDAAPQRRCLVTGKVQPKAQLLRFVVGPDGAVVFDAEGKLPGRGLWVTAQRALVEKACRRNLFARAAGGPARVADDLPALVEQRLRLYCAELLGFAKRAGLLVPGFGRCREALAAGRAALLLQAVDAAEGGRGKLARLAHAVPADIPVIEVLTAVEIGRAVGRDAAVHMVVLPGGLGARLMVELRRLQDFVGAGVPTPGRARPAQARNDLSGPQQGFKDARRK